MDYIGIFELGIIFSIFVLGMIFSFRLLGFADLTIEGSFTMGGAIFSILSISGINPVFAFLLSILGGGLAGFATASLHCFLGINKLLSGIITLTLLYTLNLRIMGKSNLFIDTPTLFSLVSYPWFDKVVLVFLCIVVFSLAKLLLSTNFGLYLRATGENDGLIRKLNYNPNKFIVIGLIISNALIAMSGSLFAQYVGYNDIGSGQGMLVSMLTAMIVGENIINPSSINRQLLAAFVGAIIFQFIYSFALEIGVNPIDLKFLIGVLLISFLAFAKYSSRKKINKNIGCDFI